MLQGTPAIQKETFAGPVAAGAPPCSAMLDLLLVPQAAVGDVVTVLSLKEATLASDHYLLYSVLYCKSQDDAVVRRVRKDMAALHRPSSRQKFVDPLLLQRDPPRVKMTPRRIAGQHFWEHSVKQKAHCQPGSQRLRSLGSERKHYN